MAKSKTEGMHTALVDPFTMGMTAHTNKTWSYWWDDSDLPEGSRLKERRDRARDRLADKKVGELQERFPHVRTQSDLLELIAVDRWTAHIAGLYKLHVKHGEVQSACEPRSGVLFGNPTVDPSPETEGRREELRRSRGELDFAGAKVDNDGRRGWVFTGGGHSEGEVPWEDDTILDHWGCGPETSEGKVVIERRIGFHQDRIWQYSDGFRVAEWGWQRPKFIKEKKFLTWVVFNKQGKEVQKLLPDTPGGVQQAKAQAQQLAERIGGWAHSVKVPLSELEQKVQVGPRKIERETLVLPFSQTVIIESPKWWRVLDEEYKPLRGMAGSSQRGRKGFYLLSWSFEKDDFNDRVGREAFLKELRCKAEEGYRIDKKGRIHPLVRVLSHQATSWGAESVQCCVPIPKKWRKLDEKLFQARPEMKYLEFTVAGPNVLVRQLREQMRVRLAKENAKSATRQARRVAKVLKERAKVREAIQVFHARRRRLPGLEPWWKLDERMHHILRCMGAANFDSLSDPHYRYFLRQSREVEEKRWEVTHKRQEREELIESCLEAVTRAGSWKRKGIVEEGPIAYNDPLTPTSVMKSFPRMTCEKCGKVIDRRRVQLALWLLFEWVVLKDGEVLDVLEFDRRGNAEFRFHRYRTRQQRRLERENRGVTRPEDRVRGSKFELKLRYKGGPGRWAVDHSYLLSRCVVVHRPQKAKVVRAGRSLVFQPPQPRRVTFCNGTDLHEQSVAGQ